MTTAPPLSSAAAAADPVGGDARDAAYWVRHLGLRPHPEGGFYREVGRGNYVVRAQNGKRRFAYSSIYFMLTPESSSHLHRLSCDEMWLWHAGDPIDVHVIYKSGDDDDLIARDAALGPPADPETLQENVSFVPENVAAARAAQRGDGEGNAGDYGRYRVVRVGPNVEEGQQLQYTVPARAIFGSTLSTGGTAGYTLVSCVVSPAFDFRDFELFTKAELRAICPQHEEIIERLAMENPPEAD